MLPRSHWFHRFIQAPKSRRCTKPRRGLSRLYLEYLEDRCVPSTYTVTDLSDSGFGTLRWAITQANNNNTGTSSSPDQIRFAVSGTIDVMGTPLPALTDIAVIDGTTAPGYAGTPTVILDGTQAGLAADGLTLSGGSSTVDALAIINFSGNGIRLDTTGSDAVLASYIGITPGNTAAGNGGNGILIANSTGDTIGGSGASAGNVISSNGGNGVLITGGANSNTVSGNFIGTDRMGHTGLGNGLDGVMIQGSNNNLIGHSDPVTGIDYFNSNNVTIQPVTAWEGIRGSDTAGNYLISGTSGNEGLLFDGTMTGVGASYAVEYPQALTTSVYGPDNLGSGIVRLVGNYKNQDYATAPVFSHGFVFEGTTTQLSDASRYRSIDFPGAKYNYVHSTMGGLAVGNYDNPAQHGLNGVPFGPGHAFIYDLATNTYLTDVVFPGSLSNTVYGIWYNGGTSYTLCGGYSTVVANNLDDQTRPIGQAYLVDYDSSTGQFSHFKSFSYPTGINFITHFEGISSVEKGVYTLSADSVQIGSSNPVQGSWVTIRRNTDGTFSDGVWVNLNVPGYNPTTFISSSNSVFGNQVVGVVIGPGTFVPFQATINTGFQLSNVISANRGNGIGLHQANDNQIAMNYIGTDVTGTLDLGNGGTGILVTDASAGNLLGGEATGGNNPTQGVFVRPPQGNLISANKAYGVLINGAATHNQLSGNFVGTNATGTAALANSLDGVAIVSADDNSLIGCTLQQDPFVFYNVIDGNSGNGLRIDDANNTTVQANFFGMGADNSTPVGNALDGVLINGTSNNSQFGGVIPLGNVDAGNGRNGVEIADTASGVVAFNTFCGLPAFVVAAVGNHLDGFLVTSTGGNNLLRTNVISGNYANGIHIGGNATGVQVAQDIIGLDTNGQAALPNGANGILVDGNAHDNTIGGYQPSVIPQSTISANGGDGIAIVGNTYNIQVFHTFIGTNILANSAFPNAGAGIFIGGNSQNNTIGGTGLFDKNVVSGNLGGGIQLSGTSHNTQVIGNLIGTDRTGLIGIPNHGNGLWIVSSNNEIGGSSAGQGNVIGFNTQTGVLVDTGTANSILGNSIFSNAAAGIGLVSAGNQNQAAPVLTGAFLPTPTTVEISGMLTAAPNATYTVEFFATSSITPPGQGQMLLGDISVTTNGIGIGVFVFSGTLAANPGGGFTATATSAANNTSAFSASIGFAGNSNTLFVNSLYGLLLNRAPDSGSVGWVNALNSGASPTQVVLGIESSTEYLADQIDALYERYLNRAADATGLQNYLGLLLAGGTLEQVAEGLVSSQEYFQDHGSTNQGYVNGLYHDVLGRAGSPAEVNAWVVALDGGTSRDQVAVDFLTSTEYRTDLVTGYYSEFLGRAPDSAGLNGWVSALESGSTDQQVLAGILGSPEGFQKWS